MPAPAHTQPHPARTGGAAPRLPWWAVLLPALAFAALLMLVLNPADAQAASGDPSLTNVVERMQQAVLRQVH
ncbi:hypothetical protein STSP_00950 [Streptomyces jeddahensis]|uniref:Uncharacterized protein n=2 Tax=Streptomyces jeddahensis TaxID=1716141 RepID=A0A177I0L6_9ACTN|nr:hypothetical protein [Streptomyces jeddahensis]OAH16500.1 hypothetical protein STSP_00950 [Streptomyces jeddahensis]